MKRAHARKKAKQNEGFAYLKLCDYHQKAIQVVEAALADKQANCLLAMATGTGKTRTLLDDMAAEAETRIQAATVRQWPMTG